MQPLLNLADAAAVLGISPRSLSRLKRRGEISYVEVTPRNHMFRECDLQDYVERKQVGVRGVPESRVARIGPLKWVTLR